MCIIIDANVASELFQPSPSDDHTPVLNWIDLGNGKMVFGGRNERELFEVEAARRRVREWARQGKAYQADFDEVQATTKRVEAAGKCTSDDPHVIALASVTQVRLLCSRDKALQQDFKALLRKPPGRIYQSKSHKALLKHTKGCVGRP